MQTRLGNLRYVTNLSSPERSTWRSLGIWISLFIVILGCLAAIILLAYIGAQLVSIQAPMARLCFVSSAINLVSVTLSLIVIWRYRYSLHSRTTVLAYSGLISLAISFCLNLASAIWILVKADSLELFNNVIAFAAALIAVVILSGIGQAILLGLITFNQTQSSQKDYFPNQSMPEITIISRPATSKTQNTSTSNPFSTRSGATSPQLSISAISIQSIPSRKNSKSLSRSSSRLSDVSQLDFHWDTSGVPATLRDTVHRKLSSKLPTIPGSRPVSPAKALDGPFLPPSPHPIQSQPTSPTNPTAFHDFSIEQSYVEDTCFLPPQLPFAESSSQSKRSYSSGPSTPKAVSRCASTTSLVESISHLATNPGPEETEGHIHPLFRSTSPTPAPYASMGTIVTAASIMDAEEVISSSRTRAPSRAGSSKPTSPLIHETEWGSIRNYSRDYISPSSPAEEDQSPWPASDVIILPSFPRSSTTSRPRASMDSTDTQTTPPSTPRKAPSIADTFTTKASSRRERPSEDGPIPSFILAAGNRNSMLDFEARLDHRDDFEPREEESFENQGEGKG